MRPPFVALLALALVALPSLGTAAAQDVPQPPMPGASDVVRVDVANIGTLPPATPKLANVTVTYCAASSGVVAGPRQIALAPADPPEWLRVASEPETFTFALVLPGECDTARGVLRFNATPDAPAFETQRVVIEARDAQNGTAYASTEYFFRIGYFGALTVTPLVGKVTAPQNEPVTHPLRVRNDGNAETTFRVNLAGSRHDAQIAIPRPLVLAPGESGTWDVMVLVPADTGLDPRSVDLLVTSHARMDHEALGESAVVRFDVQPTRGSAPSGLPLPGPAPAFAVAAVAVAAVVLGAARRRAD